MAIQQKSQSTQVYIIKNYSGLNVRIYIFKFYFDYTVGNISKAFSVNTLHGNCGVKL